MQVAGRRQARRSKKRQQWTVDAAFNISERLNEMMEEPTPIDLKKYGVDRSRLMLDEEERQEVWEAVENLKKSPENVGKRLKKDGNVEVRRIRAANDKVRIIYKIKKVKKRVIIKVIEFRPKIFYKKILENMRLTPDYFLNRRDVGVDLQEPELLTEIREGEI